MQAVQKVEEWTLVVPAKHAHVRIPYTYLRLPLREEGKDYRRMDVEFRVMDEGVAFRYTLYGARRFDYRRVQKELTGFAMPDEATVWMSQYRRPYSSSQESEFVPTPIVQQNDSLVKGLPYMLVDWKWYGKYNHVSAVPLQCADYMNVPELIAYAKEKGVGIWVWIHSSDLTQQDHWREAFPLYERWGVKGVKIDFMDHENQYGTTWYRKMIAEAARHHLMIDFHGAYKPDGVDRTYPNMMTREVVLGEEYSKFSTRITPEHNITLCFTRLLAGQMDYTPGGFLNVTQEQFLKDWKAAGGKLIRPAEVMNTRCQELAKFVIYESPVTVFCEHPDRCLGQPGMDFLREVKTIWNDTRFLDGYPAEHIELAKLAADGRWFVAGMNNGTRRTVQLDLGFLGEDTHTATLWMDAKDADKHPSKLVKKQIKVSASKPCKVEMNVGGGFVMIVEPAV